MHPRSYFLQTLSEQLHGTKVRFSDDLPKQMAHLDPKKEASRFIDNWPPCVSIDVRQVIHVVAKTPKIRGGRPR